METTESDRFSTGWDKLRITRVAIVVRALSEPPDMPSHRKDHPIAACSLCTVRLARVSALVRGASALHAWMHAPFPPTWMHRASRTNLQRLQHSLVRLRNERIRLVAEFSISESEPSNFSNASTDRNERQMFDGGSLAISRICLNKTANATNWRNRNSRFWTTFVASFALERY